MTRLPRRYRRRTDPSASWPIPHLPTRSGQHAQRTGNRGERKRQKKPQEGIPRGRSQNSRGDPGAVPPGRRPYRHCQLRQEPRGGTTRLHKFDEAQDSLNKSLEKYDSIDNVLGVIEVHNHLGRLYLEFDGDAQRALDKFRTAKSLTANNNGIGSPREEAPHGEKSVNVSK